MPTDPAGLTGTEIVARVIRYIGNTTTEFKTYVEESLPLAEYRFCKAHDWQFLHKVNLTLAITNGTSEYDLSVATIGHYMAAEDVENIFDQTNGIYLKRVDLQDIRRLDPKQDDGNADEKPSMWAPVGDNKILLWPPNFATGTLKIDGKISPPAVFNLASTPTIPFRYQESFIEYLTAMALDREDEEKATLKKQEAMALIKEDIKDDRRQLSNTANPRIRSLREARNDGWGGAVDLHNWLFWYCDY